MGGIRVANVKKTRVQIDANGNEVRPFTKEVIRHVEPAYAPTPEQIATLAEKPAPEPTPEGQNALGEMISKKVEEKIAEAVATSIGKINIEAIVAKALEQALK